MPDEAPKTENAKPAEESQKKKFVFNCTRCGKCCLSRGPVPLVMDDLVLWAKNSVVNNFMPYVRLFKTPNGSIDLVLSKEDKNPYDFMDEEGDKKEKKKEEPKEEDLTCPLYNKEKKECLVHKFRPLSCKTYPLEYDGQKFQVVDSECAGIDSGDMTPEARTEFRELAKKMNASLTQMRVAMPIIYQAMQPFVIKDLMEAQKRYMEELEKMPPEERAKIEEEMKRRAGDMKK